ncbi:transcriptional regulator with XRE-family HTH domain [Rhodoblastus acidophilus]|uniref:DNA N-6-adenine-methyltransferase n=1 Tax=Rhodoblastus acidophilus TaxID=1074 RepID=UPI0022240C4A|nr:DNA N-6-adenine-methyltransferase [Rhodoblastus acidophilus]MCW2285612.1 transcriptional regulator with XRE-family HTH domain [Rhodoblastus acidophilus]MCW2334630.1 transcriptional regulator with XRE-family HTH domain [Rhodoblastus acidophilus]
MFRAHREAHGLSRQKVSELSGLSPAQLYRLEARNEATLKTFELGAAAIGLDFKHLVAAPTLGGQIKAERTKQGLSLRTLSAMTGVSVGTIRRIERDEAHIASAAKIMFSLSPQAAPKTVRRGPIVRNRDVQLTPPDLLDQLRELFGPVCLDPCGNNKSFVDAKTTYYEYQDGLSLPWKGHFCFANPPFSAMAPWLLRAHQAWKSGDVKRVVLLLPIRAIGSRAFMSVAHDALVFVLPKRLRFWSAQTRQPMRVTAPMPSIVVLFGDELARQAARSLWGNFQFTATDPANVDHPAETGSRPVSVSQNSLLS